MDNNRVGDHTDSRVPPWVLDRPKCLERNRNRFSDSVQAKVTDRKVTSPPLEDLRALKRQFWILRSIKEIG